MVALFTIAKLCSSVEEWIKIMSVYIQIMKYCLALKNTVSSFATIWIDRKKGIIYAK